MISVSGTHTLDYYGLFIQQTIPDQNAPRFHHRHTAGPIRIFPPPNPAPATAAYR